LKTALITGITGQDGSYLAEFLLEKGYNVIGLKRRTSILSTSRIDHLYSNPNFKLEYGSMEDSSCFYRLFSQYKFDEVYNLAAQSHVRVSFDVPEETAHVNAMGPLRLLECIRLMQPEAKFYQASSSEMYGDNPDIPQNELTRLQPASPYACSKVFAHGLTRNYREGYKIHASSGILFNHESPRRGETFVTRKITLAAAKIKHGMQSEIELGNLHALRDWGYAKDYVEAMWLMLQQNRADDYVIATGETHTVREFLDEVFELAGLDPDKYLKINERLYRPHEVPVLMGDAEKARNKLGWEPKTSFKELAKLMYESDFAYVKNEVEKIK
jgi:GDPmannose 4,6-dehydratase